MGFKGLCSARREGRFFNYNIGIEKVYEKRYN